MLLMIVDHENNGQKSTFGPYEGLTINYTECSKDELDKRFSNSTTMSQHWIYFKNLTKEELEKKKVVQMVDCYCHNGTFETSNFLIAGNYSIFECNNDGKTVNKINMNRRQIIMYSHKEMGILFHELLYKIFNRLEVGFPTNFIKCHNHTDRNSLLIHIGDRNIEVDLQGEVVASNSKVNELTEWEVLDKLQHNKELHEVEKQISQYDTVPAIWYVMLLEEMKKIATEHSLVGNHRKLICNQILDIIKDRIAIIAEGLNTDRYNKLFEEVKEVIETTEITIK